MSDPLRPLSVLFVEDDPDAQLLIERQLRRSGYAPDIRRVETLAELRAALAGPYDVVLSDYNLGAVTALDVLAVFRAEGRDVPFIIVSGAMGDELGVTAMLSGAHDYIFKGNLSRLAPAIERELREADGRRDRRAAQDALRRANEELEARIRARTEDLERVARSEREAHEALKLAQAHLVQAEKLAAFGQMVAGIAHEVNNPLAYVINNVAVLQRDVGGLAALVERYQTADAVLAREAPALAEELRDAAARLDLPYVLTHLPAQWASTRDGLSRILQLVLDLRVFARLDRGDFDDVDLDAGVASTINVLRGRAAQRRVTLSLALGPVGRVYHQPSKINQVVMNLVANAIDASPVGGDVAVETRLAGAWVEVSVADRGEGIAPEVAGRIFEPVVTTKPPGEGTGLGLSISYGIVQEHMGEIVVSSEPGRGATFVVRLPRDRRGLSGRDSIV
jgi:signal transduction histidine kinase